MKLQLAALWRSAKPLFIGTAQRKSTRSWVVVAYALSGVLLGLAMGHPRFAFCAWFSTALLAIALGFTESKLGAFAGALLTHGVGRYVGLDWVAGMNALVFDFSPVESWAFLFAQSLAWAMPFGLSIGIGYVLFGKRVAPCWWLPLAWGAGEVLRFQVMCVNLGDWIATQWMFDPVLRMLGRIGWWPTFYVCLFASCCIGQAFVTRRAWVMLPAAPLAAVLALLPPLPSPGTDLLRGIAAVHTTSTVDLPHATPPQVGTEDHVDLVLWPETLFDFRPYLVEGKHNKVHLPRLLHDSNANHLLGVLTTFPMIGAQNQVVALRADGLVLGSRAKKLLLPTAERPYLGVGKTRYVPGRASTFLQVAERSIISVICGEFLSRSLIAEGREAGGKLLVVVARDSMMVNDRAKRQLLAVQVVRSVEFGVPSVRASYGGWANFISADGKVLALSNNERNGMLRWDAEHGARDHDFWGDDISKPAPVRPPPQIAILYAKDAPMYRTRCPQGRCSYHALEDFHCADVRASTVIVAGHAAPPNYLSGTAKDVATAIRCFSPELIVVDTCFGASTDLLEQLTDLDVMVVASSVLVPTSGLEYLPAFFTSRDPVERARAIVDAPGNPLLRWRMSGDELSAARTQVAAMDAGALGTNLRRRRPAYVGVHLAGSGDVLVPVDEDRLRNVVFPAKKYTGARARVRDSKDLPREAGFAPDVPDAHR